MNWGRLYETMMDEGIVKEEDIPFSAGEITEADIASMWDDWEVMDWMDDAKTDYTREHVLNRAKECVCGHREQDYGSPEDNFATIAAFWTAYMGVEFSALDVSMMMALLKIARIKNGGGSGDSFVDLAGYAACGGEIWGNGR